MLSPADRHTLLTIAREAVAAAVNNQPLPTLDLDTLSPALREIRSCFVTLTIGGTLRGCIGGIEAMVLLALDVQEHAVGAALNDYRFPPVTSAEAPQLRIEISILTTPEPVPYHKPEELLTLLRPHIDGVILRLGSHRATFLPQVWDKVPDPELFLEMLSEKMGADRSAWRSPAIKVYRYQVEEFEEEKV